MLIKNYKKLLFIPDTHVPYHDPRAIEIIKRVASDTRFDEICYLGDFWDIYSLSSHEKNREKEVKDLEDEILPGRKIMADIENASRARSFTFCMGNHEDRINRFINRNFESLHKSISAREILGIPRHYKVIPYGHNGFLDLGKLIVTHGSICSRHHAAAMLGKYGGSTSILYGHTHKIQRYCQTTVKGDVVEAVSAGWLGDATKVADYIKNVADWQQGFAVGTFFKNGKYFLETPMIKNGECYYNGKHYKAR